jgi:mannobiose 2-epimerase
MYGLAEHYRATGAEEALSRALALFRVLEEHAFDRAAGGYREALARDWRPLADVRLSERDLNAPFSMNTHLHLLEAYTGLLLVADNPELRARLGALVDIFTERILDTGRGHLKLFFDESWRSLGPTVSFGHDIEASWLLNEAAAAVGDPVRARRAAEAARLLAEATLKDGYDRERGGVFAEAEPGERLDTNKHWWMQAEAVVGFLDAFERSGRVEFCEAAIRTWDFIRDHIIDREYGEWFWRVSREGELLERLPKVEPWKCPYHNTRAHLEIRERVSRLTRRPA